MVPSPSRLPSLSVVVLALACVGCGGGGSSDAPDTVPVSGTITMDGEPLADARVVFAAANPADRLRTVSGITDSSGEYELEFTSSQSGAQPGKYLVSVSTYREDEEGGAPRPETVPANYNAQTTLTAEVSADSKVHDFELDSSSGEVAKPSREE